MSDIKLTLSNTDPPASDSVQLQHPPDQTYPSATSVPAQSQSSTQPGNHTTPPTLTLTPDTSTGKIDPSTIFAQAAQDFQKAEIFTAEDRQQMTQIASQIKLGSNQAIVRYGADLQKKISRLTESDLSMAQRNLDPVGALFRDMHAAIENFGQASTERGLSGLFRRSHRPAVLQDCYLNTLAELQRIQKELDGQRLTLSVAIRHLEKNIYPQLLQSYKQLAIYIRAGRDYLDASSPPDLNPTSFSPFPQKSDFLSPEQRRSLQQNYRTGCYLFEKRLDDLELTKTICLQSAFQALLLIYTYQQLVIQIQSHLTNSVAIWQQSVATAFTVKGYQAAVQSSNAQLISAIDSGLDLQKTGSHSQSLAAAYQQTS